MFCLLPFYHHRGSEHNYGFGRLSRQNKKTLNFYSEMNWQNLRDFQFPKSVTVYFYFPLSYCSVFCFNINKEALIIIIFLFWQLQEVKRFCLSWGDYTVIFVFCLFLSISSLTCSTLSYGGWYFPLVSKNYKRAYIARRYNWSKWSTCTALILCRRPVWQT